VDDGSGEAPPAVTVLAGAHAATRLRFAPDGARLAIGDVAGGVTIVELGAELVVPARGEDAAAVAERWADAAAV